MSIAQALAIRCELNHKLSKVAPQDRPAVIRINQKIAAIDFYLKSAPPMMSPTRAGAR
jgi:hypothetical protein